MHGASHPELGADRVGGLLGHEPVGRDLAADDRDEVADAVAGLVVDDQVGPRDLAAVLDRSRRLVVLVERSDAGVRAQQAHLRQVREELRALNHQLRDFLAADTVDVRILDGDLRRPEDGDLVDRHHDVAVGRAVAAIDDRIGHPLVEDEHRALAGRHRELDPRKRGHAARPRTRGGDDESRRDAGDGAAPPVSEIDRDDPLAGGQLHGDRAVIRPDQGTSRARVGDGSFDQLPRLQRAVGDAEGAADGGVERRFAAEEVGDIDVFAGDARGDARRGEPIEVLLGIVRRRDEVAAGILDAGRGDPPQDPVLGDALAGGGGVLDDVPAARMKQAVMPAARPAAKVALVNEEAAETTTGEVSNETRPRGSAADDEDVDRKG